MNEVICIGDKQFHVNIKLEKRNNFRVSIGKKSISIRTPDFLPREELFKNITKMKQWARQKILNNPERFKQEPQRTYQNGQEIAVGNETYLLMIDYSDKSSSSAKMKGNTIFLNISSNLDDAKKSSHISTLISRCIAGKKLSDVKKRVDELNKEHFQREIKQVFLKYNKSNWGSCSENSNINISTRALFAPPDVLDYLCIHELAHLVEQNHSDNFWALVEKAMPDYKDKQKWLRENGDKCRF